MRKKNKHHIEDFNQESQWSSSWSEEGKFSRRQQLMRLFLTTEFKNTHLRSALSGPKDSLIRNLEGTKVQASDINGLFWVYFNENKNIFVPRHLRKLIRKYTASLQWPNGKIEMDVDDYLLRLRAIRESIKPFADTVKPTIVPTVKYANTVTDHEFSTGVFSETEHGDANVDFAKRFMKKFLSLMPTLFPDGRYTMERFDQESNVILEKFFAEDSASVIIFAILGIHLFDRKSDVYRAFNSKNALIRPISFEFSDDKKKKKKDKEDVTYTHTITLQELLSIITNLNFRKNFFRIR